jgi:hypothetical protein
MTNSVYIDRTIRSTGQIGDKTERSSRAHQRNKKRQTISGKARGQRLDRPDKMCQMATCSADRKSAALSDDGKKERSAKHVASI